MTGMERKPPLEERFPGFGDFVRDQLSGRLGKLEAQKNSWLDRRKKARALGWGVGLAAGVWFAQASPDLATTILRFAMAAFIIGGICSLLARRYLTKAFEGDVQSELLTPLCRFFRLGYERRPVDFHLYGFQQLGLVPDYDQHDLRNRIYGDWQGGGFELVELKLAEQGIPKLTGERGYQGVLFRLSARRRFEGRTVILDRGVSLDSLTADFREYREQDLGSNPFTRIYQTLGTDPGEAGQLLPDEVVSGLVAIRHKSGVKSVRGAFVNGNFLLAVEFTQRPFEVDVEKAAFRSSRLVEKYVDELEDLLAIVEALRPIS